MTRHNQSSRLFDISPELELVLTRGDVMRPRFSVSAIRCETVAVRMRDGVQLATDLYLPPLRRAPVVALRTPYDRALDDSGLVGAFLCLSRRGYVVVAQDCRGTGSSEPDEWDYYMYECDDGYDLVEWITVQEWYGGFIGSFGGSYVGQTQWPMALHPAMSTIVPNVSGLGIASNSVHLYMFLNAYAKSVGKGHGKASVPYYEMERLMIDETLAGGYFNEPLDTQLASGLLDEFPELRGMSSAGAKRWLWEKYCEMSCAERAQFVKGVFGTKNVSIVEVESLTAVFGHGVSHDALTIPNKSQAELCRSLQAPPLMRTGWYDWCLNDAFATWEAIRDNAKPDVAERARLIITPYSHNTSGYREGCDTHPELIRQQTMLNMSGLLLRWYEAVRENRLDQWPRVIYYLMGANEWRTATDWPVPDTNDLKLFIHRDGSLSQRCPTLDCKPATYTYDPRNPTPTVGGSIVSFVYPPGSVDVSTVQKRLDVLSYTTDSLQEDMDVVGKISAVLYVSSSAVDTDFIVRVSDVFPDGRAIQLQTGALRTRYRITGGEPALLEPYAVYRLEIDVWPTANRFMKGHKCRIDISSSDFPHFDRNSNTGGGPGDPVAAEQAIYCDSEHASYVVLPVLGARGVLS